RRDAPRPAAALGCRRQSEEGARHTLWTELGLVSAYHTFYNQALGETNHPTDFHTYKRDRGWHIDWVLLHRSRISSLHSVTVGSYEAWPAAGVPAGSDHVPVIVDLGY